MPRVNTTSKKQPAPQQAAAQCKPLRLKTAAPTIKVVDDDAPPRMTLEDAVALLTKKKLAPSKPIAPREFLEGLCEHHSGLSGEAWKALEMVQAERFLNAPTTRDGTEAYLALLEGRKLDISVGKMVLDAANGQRNEVQQPQVPDEELLKGLRLVSAQLVEEQPTLTTASGGTDDLDDEVLPLEGVG